jgi:three-Cys-motif partner protein
MAKPQETIWKAEPHTLAKHQLLRRYLNAWLPIMARNEVQRGMGQLLLIDGFAGPGRYQGGEPGSPLIMLDALFSHADRDAILKAKFSFVFIENDKERVEHLREEVARVETHPNVQVDIVEGSFDEVMAKALDEIPDTQRLIPAFAFIDPFGYAGKHVELSSRILGYSRCEVLIYVPLPNIARFIEQDLIAEALTNLYGDESWKAAREASSGREAEKRLHDIFLGKLAERAKYVRSFEMDGRGGWAGYHLFFGSQHKMGLLKMKDAMWRIDPGSGSRFADATDPSQMVLFGDKPDLSPLRSAMEANFGHRWFTVEAAQDFVLLDTPYHPDIHLKTKLLKVVEAEGRLEGRHRKKTGTYPPGSQVRFVKEPD